MLSEKHIKRLRKQVYGTLSPEQREYADALEEDRAETRRLLECAYAARRDIHQREVSIGMGAARHIKAMAVELECANAMIEGLGGFRGRGR